MNINAEEWIFLGLMFIAFVVFFKIFCIPKGRK